jgi:N6-adenosine-specific RNA methylase IME4
MTNRSSICETSYKARDGLDQSGAPKALLLSVAQKLNQRYFGIRDAAVQGFIEIGQELRKAKGMLAYGAFGPWCDKHLAFGWNTAQAFMRIARWAETNAEHAQHLPADWTTILSITRLDDDALTELIKDGTIHPAATRSDIQRKIKQTKRVERHKQIAEEAGFAAQAKLEEGRFALIYADPPWSDQTVEDIADLEVYDFPIRHLAGKDAVLFMWCTSANLKRAIAALEGWGFAYQTHFIWDKQKTGTGSICLNQHELLLYGTRSNAPTPLKLFPSVFRSECGAHSAKPAAVREMIEIMFPYFNEHSRIELFHRGPKFDGWTVWAEAPLSKEACAPQRDEHVPVHGDNASAESGMDWLGVGV